ncbi:hypothetical protein GH714_036733 [Hevea brasiliensis]|uniref:Uncharacterized protein n=1 Tax=Hevea brasiliensis TaxID=3981 RepID=A0A6A6L7F6_HEVBR|nr:hypothetical protein GH714_036733 [Hevea brasiliensis]
MELLTGDRRVPNSTTDFAQRIFPFQATGNLLISNPMAVIHSSDIDGQNLPPQKLRPIRANGRSPSSSQANDLPLVDGLDGTLENLGLLADQCVGLVERIATDSSAGIGSDAGGENQHPNGVRGLLEVESR